MRESESIISDLKNVDGSCRDINFESPTWDGVVKLVRDVSPDFCTFAAHDSEGKEFSELEVVVRKLPLSPKETLKLTLNEGSTLVNHLQLFIYCESDGVPFIELTFFPQDLDESKLTIEAFRSWVEELREKLGATRYFVRYENASWKFGDTQPGSGMICVSQ